MKTKLTSVHMPEDVLHQVAARSEGGNGNGNGKRFYTVKEIIGILGLSRVSVYRLVHEPEFPALRIGNRILVPVAGFEDWLAAQNMGGAE